MKRFFDCDAISIVFLEFHLEQSVEISSDFIYSISSNDEQV